MKLPESMKGACTIYISGPISKRSQMQTQKHFGEARKALEEQGYDVMDPTKLGFENAGVAEWDKFMREGIKLLMDCDAIYMLEGYEHSRGAKLEWQLADKLGMHIWYEKYGDFITKKEILNE